MRRLALRGNDDLEMRQGSLQTLLSLPRLQLLDLSKAFCPIDEDFMDMDLCTGYCSDRRLHNKVDPLYSALMPTDGNEQRWQIS